MQRLRRTDLFIVLVAFFSFVVLGLPGGLLNVAYSPSMLNTFNLSRGDIGVLGFATTVGYLSASFSSGRLAFSWSLGVFLTGGSVLMGIGLLGIAFAPAWLILVGFGFLLGLGSGAIDSGLNTYAATNRSPVFMNWLHASFGFGAAIGPLIMTALLSGSLAWQVGYVLVGLVTLLLALAFVTTRKRWTVSPSLTTDQTTPQHAPMRHTLVLPIVWLMALFFAIYAGVESSGGQWSFDLFKSRGTDETTAGLWVSVYWASLTVGRIVFGALSVRFNAYNMLRWCIYGMIAGALLISLNISNGISFLGLAMLGFLQAPMFPIMVSKTPQIVGHSHAANSIGFQVAAAGVGLAALPAVAGILADRVGMEVIGPFLVIFSIAIYILYEIVIHVKQD